MLYIVTFFSPSCDNLSVIFLSGCSLVLGFMWLPWFFLTTLLASFLGPFHFCSVMSMYCWNLKCFLKLLRLALILDKHDKGNTVYLYKFKYHLYMGLYDGKNNHDSIPNGISQMTNLNFITMQICKTLQVRWIL